MSGAPVGSLRTPAKPNDYITLFGTGFGATNPSFGAGELPGTSGVVTGPIPVTVDGIALDPFMILYAGVTQNAGFYQLNIQLPGNLPDGDLPVMLTISGKSSSPGGYITVKN